MTFLIQKKKEKKRERKLEGREKIKADVFLYMKIYTVNIYCMGMYI